MRFFFALIILAITAGSAAAQNCGSGNPNCLAPTAPVTANNNQIANTAWVNQFITQGGDCGPGNPNCLAPTAPITANNNQIANTAWVNQFINQGDIAFGSGNPWCDITAWGAQGNESNNASIAWGYCLNQLYLQSYGTGIGTIFVPQGQYCVDGRNPTGTASFAGTQMTVNSVTGGFFAIGDYVTFAGQTGNPRIIGVPTVAGLTGVYTLSVSQSSISNESISATWAAAIDLPPSMTLTVRGVGYITGSLFNGNLQACSSAQDQTVFLVENHDIIYDLTVYGYNTSGSTHSTVQFLTGGAAAYNLWSQFGLHAIEVDAQDVVLVNPQAGFSYGSSNFYVRSAVYEYGGAADQQFPTNSICSGYPVTEPAARQATTIYSTNSCINANGYIFQAISGGTTSGGNFPSGPYHYFNGLLTDGSVTWQLVAPWPFAAAQFDTLSAGSVGEAALYKMDMSGAFNCGMLVSNSLSGVPYQFLKTSDIIAPSLCINAGNNITISESELYGPVSIGSGVAGGILIQNNPWIAGTITIGNFATPNAGISIVGNVFNTSSSDAIDIDSNVTDVTMSGNTMTGITGKCVNIASGADYINFMANNCHGATITNSSSGMHINASSSNNY